MAPDPRQSLHEIVLAAAEAITLEELALAPLALLKDAVQASGAVLYRHHADGRLHGVGGDLAEVLGGYGAEHFASDPYHDVPRRLAPQPRVVAASRAVDVHALRSSVAWADFYRAWDLASVTCVWLTHRAYATPGMTGILLTRAATQPDFDDDALRLVEGALPALSAAVARSERVHRLRSAHDGLEAALEALEAHACVVIDAMGKVLWSSRGIARLLAHRALPACVIDEARRLCQAACGDDDDAAALRFAFPVEMSSGAPLRASIRLGRRASHEPVAIVRLESLETASALRSNRQRIASQYRLTPSECEVLHQVALGLSNRAIAERLSVSIETIRTHVKRVLRKLGVRTRVQASLVVWSDEPGEGPEG